MSNYLIDAYNTGFYAAMGKVAEYFSKSEAATHAKRVRDDQVNMGGPKKSFSDASMHKWLNSRASLGEKSLARKSTKLTKEGPPSLMSNLGGQAVAGGIAGGILSTPVAAFRSGKFGKTMAAGAALGAIGVPIMESLRGINSKEGRTRSWKRDLDFNKSKDSTKYVATRALYDGLPSKFYWKGV